MSQEELNKVIERHQLMLERCKTLEQEADSYRCKITKIINLWIENIDVDCINSKLTDLLDLIFDTSLEDRKEMLKLREENAMYKRQWLAMDRALSEHKQKLANIVQAIQQSEQKS